MLNFCCCTCKFNFSSCEYGYVKLNDLICKFDDVQINFDIDSHT